jgi:hypothetical protein
MCLSNVHALGGVRRTAAESHDGAAGSSREVVDAPQAKRKRTSTKEYVPQVGTANYAFLVVLYMVSTRTASHAFLVVLYMVSTGAAQEVAASFFNCKACCMHQILSRKAGQQRSRFQGTPLNKGGSGSAACMSCVHKGWRAAAGVRQGRA